MLHSLFTSRYLQILMRAGITNHSCNLYFPYLYTFIIIIIIIIFFVYEIAPLWLANVLRCSESKERKPVLTRKFSSCDSCPTVFVEVQWQGYLPRFTSAFFLCVPIGSLIARLVRLRPHIFFFCKLMSNSVSVSMN